MDQPTLEERKLYVALRRKNIECDLHYNDGHKTVDIAIHNPKLIIEVDGLYHYLRAKSIVKDIWRKRYSEKNGYETLHIYNGIIDEHLDEFVEAINKIVKKNIKK